MYSPHFLKNKVGLLVVIWLSMFANEALSQHAASNEDNGFLFAGKMERNCLVCPSTNSTKYTFEAAISGCRWSIKTKPDALWTNQYEYQITSYDGTNIYSLTVFGKKTGSINTSQASVHPAVDPVPGGDSDVMPVWLAFASSCYFKNEDKGVARNCWMPFDPQSSSEKWKILMRTNQVMPYLPERIEFYHDGFSRGISKEGEVVRLSYPSPFNTGFVYRVFSSANFLQVKNHAFPKEFHLDFFELRISPKKEVADQRIALAHSIFGFLDKVENVRFNASDFIPATDGLAYTTDSRLADDKVAMISYLNTNANGQWIPANSSTLKAIQLAEKENRLKQDNDSKIASNSKNRKRAVVVVIVLSASAIFLFLMFRFKSH